jgi:putative transposase
MLKIVHDATTTDAVDDPESTTVDLDELFRMAAQEMLAVTLLAERRAYLDAHADVTDATGRRMVVGNGYARQRAVMTGAGMVDVNAPRVDDRRQDEKFSSALLPAYMRRSPKVTEVLPVLYLRGLSTGDFGPALEGFFGSKAGLSASTICRLTEAWQAELEEWKTRDLSDVDYVYWWADGVHFNIRLEEDRLCCLVIVGVRPDGTKELVAVDDGYRESTDSWAELLRSLRDRGVVAPVLAVGDGALGFWGALRDVFPSTREQRCWVHKTANCLDAMPKRVQPEAKAAIASIYGAETRADALVAVQAFADRFAEWPKATAKITGELDTLLAFYDFPAEHWVHLRTTNPIESTFATVRLRTKVTKGAGSREAGMAMAFKLLDAAQARWRRINGHDLVPLVRAGATFIDGKLRERKEAQTETTNTEKAGSVAA